MTQTPRQRKQAFKAWLLDELSVQAIYWDSSAVASDTYGLTAEQYDEVRKELQTQLFAWAVRITPKEVVDPADLELAPHVEGESDSWNQMTVGERRRFEQAYAAAARGTQGH